MIDSTLPRREPCVFRYADAPRRTPEAIAADNYRRRAEEQHAMRAAPYNPYAEL